MDTNDSGGLILYPDRLSRMKLSDENVRYYTLDETGRITASFWTTPPAIWIPTGF